ncbi:23S rRNA m(1)G-748 methyltransferase [Desulfallas thermosapovorans DSM 6562]|uniref:23S rRNA m(1)G-748 methyltransferase n=2 Tax=Desulfallas thermosapovorans TaxID=58137 RepID=A0A5S4ZXZ1_9FIRM|nr:23S rRNA m(1)G-748 methyltransferase [Desulfallas thermosapovorans DSM 6562]
MLTHPQHTKYDKMMFKSRRIVSKSGFFAPLDEKIIEIIMDNSETAGALLTVLDAGCGEGSRLAGLQEKITRRFQRDFLGVGLDISKDGIIIASKDYKNNIWCVGDLARAPFADRKFNIILNILSPANYMEFRRMITDDSIIIKVIPERCHLQELRAVFYQHTDKQNYSNDDTLELFKTNFKLKEIKRVHYKYALEHTGIEPLIRMTPLSWGTTEERLQKAREMNLREVTVDLIILVGGN